MEQRIRKLMCEKPQAIMRRNRRGHKEIKIFPVHRVKELKLSVLTLEHFDMIKYYTDSMSFLLKF